MASAVCSGGGLDLAWLGTIQLKNGCRIRKIPDWVHEEKRGVFRVLSLTANDNATTTVADSCFCNEVRGVVNRVLAIVPTPEVGALKVLKRAAGMIRRELSRKMQQLDVGAPLSRDEVISAYTGIKKQKYQSASELLDREGMDFIRDVKVTGFIKAEKSLVDGPGDIKDPRVIQFRTPKYTLELMRYLKQVEKALYALKSPREFGLKQSSRIVAKGLNQRARGEALRRKCAQFRNVAIIALDASRWDKHVSYEALEVEHSVYEALFPGDEWLRKLLKQQLVNKCSMFGGLQYTCRGGRMSGDANTALGNCLMMIVCVVAACIVLKLLKYDIFDDGDDCLLLMEREEWTDGLRARLIGAFRTFGFVLKVESVAYALEDVTHCQTRPTYVSNYDDGPRQPGVDRSLGLFRDRKSVV